MKVRLSAEQTYNFALQAKLAQEKLQMWGYFSHEGEANFVDFSSNNSKYFEIRTIPLQIYENFEGILLTLWKDKFSDNTSTGSNNV